MDRSDRIKYEAILQVVFIISGSLLAMWFSLSWVIGYAVSCSLSLYIWHKWLDGKDSSDKNHDRDYSD